MNNFHFRIISIISLKDSGKNRLVPVHGYVMIKKKVFRKFLLIFKDFSFIKRTNA